MTPDRLRPAPVISIICPAFNEADGMEHAIRQLRSCLDDLSMPVEVLIVNDGSTDGTVDAAKRGIGADGRFRILSHKVNFGRGRALRTGFLEARGDILVTTEADLSWGADVVGRMIGALERNPRLDAVFASPHLPGGGYRNVPWHRVLLSRIGNRILRVLYPSKVSMTTGMTRAYRAHAIRGQVFMQDGKELHLEIAHRLIVLGYRIGEVPAILSWPENTAASRSRRNRTNWTGIRKLILSHLSFGILEGISRIVGPAVVLIGLAIAIFGIWGLWNFLTGAPSIYLVMLTAVLLILWVTLFIGYFLVSHVFRVEGEVWRTQQLVVLQSPLGHPATHAYYAEEPRAGHGQEPGRMLSV